MFKYISRTDAPSLLRQGNYRLWLGKPLINNLVDEYDYTEKYSETKIKGYIRVKESQQIIILGCIIAKK